MRALVVGVRAALCAALAGPALAHDSAHGQGYVNVFAGAEVSISGPVFVRVDVTYVRGRRHRMEILNA